MITTLQQLMTLLLRQAESRHSVLCTSVTWICALTALLLFNSISTAGELEELSVTESDGEYRLQIVSIFDAPADYVYYVITDYLHAYRINPTITEVEILPSDRDDVVRVRNLSEQCVGPICFNIDWVGDIVEPSYGNINVETIPEFSSFESGSAVWEIRPRGERTWVLHESNMKPNFFIPPVIGDNIMKTQMEDETLDTFKRIECHAMIMLERDMEHDAELLKKLLKEGKDCINTHMGSVEHIVFRER
ncbi:MAG: SRPBCC family protein [Gammaproteobacteria bacterium]